MTRKNTTNNTPAANNNPFASRAVEMYGTDSVKWETLRTYPLHDGRVLSEKMGEKRRVRFVSSGGRVIATAATERELFQTRAMRARRRKASRRR
ncbi:hypothetical protein GF420_15855 [candidate division GN15 bacterium]|nr:hypothetical protein [candidate division GN15 bacterium]